MPIQIETGMGGDRTQDPCALPRELLLRKLLAGAHLAAGAAQYVGTP